SLTGRGVSYGYDNDCRLTSEAITSDPAGNNGALGYTYGTTTLGYDGDGNRVSESVGGATTKYLVDTLNPTGLAQVLDETVNGAVTRTYGYGLQRISENQMNGPTWTPSFYGYDGHGNVRFMTSSAGTVTDTYQYDAFRRLVALAGNAPNSYMVQRRVVGQRRPLQPAGAVLQTK